MSYRNIKDAELQVSKALPAAAANANSDSIDLGQAALDPSHLDVEVRIPATTTLVDTKLVTVKVQDSADDSSFADIAGLGSQTVVGISGNGNAETDLRWRLPATTRRYIRTNVAVETGGGDNTAASAVLSVIF